MYREYISKQSPCKSGMDGQDKQTQDFHPGDRCSCPEWNEKINVDLF